jgi:hypothetical protein
MTDPASAGATPVAGGATPPQTPAQPAAPTTGTPAEPATGYPDGLGDAGKRALDAERARADKAEKDLKAAQARAEELENASRTDQEKAIAQAKKDGAAEVLATAQAQVRRSEVRAGLLAAGIGPNVLDLAAKADTFANLKVTDDGTVQGLDQAIADFKKTVPDLFKPAGPTGGRPVDYGGGPRGTPAGGGHNMNDLIRAATGRG